MIQIINPNSYIIAAGLIVLIALAVVVMRFRKTPIAWIALTILTSGLIAGNLVFRVGTSEIQTPAQFDQILANGKPVVLEIYSDY